MNNEEINNIPPKVRNDYKIKKQIDDIEMALYSKMCGSCPRAKYCHEECENCEEFEDTLDQELAKFGLNRDMRDY